MVQEQRQAFLAVPLLMAAAVVVGLILQQVLVVQAALVAAALVEMQLLSEPQEPQTLVGVAVVEQMIEAGPQVVLVL